MLPIPKHLSKILQRAAQRAMPELTDPISVTFEKNKAWDYVCPSAMKFYNMHKKKGAFGFENCQAMANAIVENIEPENNVIEKIELAQAGNGDPAKSGFFLNIYLRQDFIQEQIKSIYMSQAVRL